MTIWFIILWVVIFLLGVSFIYLGMRVPKFLNPTIFVEWSKIKYFLFGSCITLGVIGLITLCLDFVNAVICVLYLAMIWMISDFIFWVLEKVFHLSFQHYYAGWLALILTVAMLIAGWYVNHHVVQTNYELITKKNVPNFRIAMIADVHLGTTFDAKGFADYLDEIQQQNPDVVVVVGDYVDDSSKKDEMVKASRALGKIKTKYGVYFVLGNHDRGYYGAKYRGFSKQGLIDALASNGVRVLQDEIVLVADSFYIIGRKDASETKERNKHRTMIFDFVDELDKGKYIIVLDHQPTDFKNQMTAMVDLVLSGHTHGGQLFPFNQVGKWIGANDLVYGHEHRHKTDFIVTSGISNWAIKFKTGTKSEFVIIDIKQGR